MPLSLLDVEQLEKLPSLLKIVDEHCSEGTTDADRERARSSILEAASRSSLVGPDMMRAIAHLQRSQTIKLGLYKALADLDRDLGKLKAQRSATAEPVRPVKAKTDTTAPPAPAVADAPADPNSPANIAKALGLKHLSWGRYEGADGVKYASQGGKLWRKNSDGTKTEVSAP